MSNPTKRQIKRLYTLAGRAGLEHDEVLQQLQRAYSVSSSRDLTLAQYEDYCLHLEALAGLRYAGDGKSPEEMAAAYPTVWKREQVDALLTEFWVNCLPQLRPRLLEVLNDFRLGRRDGRISRRILATTIEKIKLAPPAAISAALDVWLEKYRSGKDEHYFIGILRRKKRDADAEGNPPSLKLRRTGGSKVGGQSQPGRSTPTDHERRQAAIAESREAEFQAMLNVIRSVAGGCGTGDSPVMEGEHGQVAHATCICERGLFLQIPIPGGQLLDFACPFCEAGIGRLRSRLRMGATHRGILAMPWRAIREKVKGAKVGEGTA